MANTVVIGAQWGDEGKAKIIDLLAKQADVVIRCQGGCNAGHTVSLQGNVYKFHLVPSGLLYNDKLCIIGPGTVIDPWVLLNEIKGLQEKGISTGTLKISDRAHLTLPYHVKQDAFQENAREQKKIGTTGKGIGPTYMDKVGRIGLRIGDLYLSDKQLKTKLTNIFEAKLFKADTFNDLLDDIKAIAEQLKPYVADTIPVVHQAIMEKKQLLFEGAQGTMLDVDYGTYPYVTSSNATAGGACTGSGVGPSKIDQVIGVMKAYITRVGEGPMPTELTDETGAFFQSEGQEFGTTTGRLRRCGWFDAVVGRYSVMVNGLDVLAITKLDVLDKLEAIKICTSYKHKQTGKVLSDFPAQIEILEDFEPIYATMPGWQTPTTEIEDYDALPQNAKNYLDKLSELCNCPIGIVSIGPNRKQTIFKKEILENTTADNGSSPLGLLQSV